MLPQIERTLPEGMKVEIAYDTTVFIRASIKEVYTTIAEAVALVVLVIFFFLRSGRAVLIPLVTIPVSLIGTFALMAALGFRSEEHTSELQSLMRISYAVFCMKKKKMSTKR